MVYPEFGAKALTGMVKTNFANLKRYCLPVFKIAPC